jgi:Sulfotransferase family
VAQQSSPVFVLCAGRSGSTLLRFLLDAHPDLACPPETNIPALCGQLATVWSLIEGAPLSANRGDEPPEIPDAAIAGVRDTVDRMVGSYLVRRGKQRYCDKSLGTARFAYLLTRIWPESRFLCLYRHPMDVIASGIEACPWGLNGYGFDGYIAETPGNAVWALARFWADNVSVIRAAEDQYPQRCHRVRYEDLVADPQGTADAIFTFLGVEPVPGIAQTCFAPERERFGPADYKIWHTSRITGDSVGRGWTVPAGLIAAPARQRLNELCEQLGYLPVDDSWGTDERPADLRLHTPRAAAPAPAQSIVVVPLLAERLVTAPARVGADFAQRWRPCAADTFMLVATPESGAGPGERWLVDLAAGEVTAVGGGEEPDSGWDLIGPADTWDQVLAGRLNLSVALRRNQLRYCDAGNAGPVVAEARMGMLGELLGLTSWRRACHGVERVEQPVAAAAP